MNKIRWGLLSTARINSQLIPIIRTSKRGQLAAVASRDQQAAQDYAERWEIPLAFGSYQAMLDSGEIDAVYNSLPNHLHAEWSIKALQAGVHVLCEKPFATSLQEVDAMIAASQQNRRVLAEALMYRHHPQTRVVKELIQSKKLGEINLVRGKFSFRLDATQDVRLVPEFGGGSLWDVGGYPVSYAQFVFGSAPVEVFGMQEVGSTRADLTFTGLLRYASGKMAQISSSFLTPYHQAIEITGSEGTLELNRPFNQINEAARVILTPNDGTPEKIRVPKKELYAGEVEDMHAAILDGAQQLVSLVETRNHMRTVLALYESARTGKPVSLQP
jgi:predicted dehydrogenase